MTVYIGAIQNTKPVLLSSSGQVLRTLGNTMATTCIVDDNKVLVCQTDGVVKLYDVQGNSLRQYPLPNPYKAVAATFINKTQVNISTFQGKTFVYTLDGQPLRKF